MHRKKFGDCVVGGATVAGCVGLGTKTKRKDFRLRNQSANNVNERLLGLCGWCDGRMNQSYSLGNTKSDPPLT